MRQSKWKWQFISQNICKGKIIFIFYKGTINVECKFNGTINAECKINVTTKLSEYFICFFSVSLFYRYFRVV